MLSIHHLVTTLSGCVLIASNLDKYLSEVVGITGNDPNCVQPPAKKTSLLFERIKWAMWKETEVTVFIEDLQRHKLSLSLMLGIIQCHTTAEASERLGKLEEVVDAISIQLRDLLSRHDAPIRDEIGSKSYNQSKAISILPGKDNLEMPLSAMKDDQAPNDNDDAVSFRTAATSVHIRSMQSDNICNDHDDTASFRTAATSLSKLSLRPMQSEKFPNDNDDAASFATAATSRSILSLRSIRSMLSSYVDELRGSRPYKRIKRWGISDDSYSAFSNSSSARGCSWSMLSDMSLGDLSISEISVMVLPICLSDLWNSQPYEADVPLHSAADRYRLHQKLSFKWSSLKGIHYAIHKGNEIVIRTLLDLGKDIERRDSEGRTPLTLAAYMGHQSICKLLLERGASMKGVIHNAICEGNENAIRILLALGTDIEERDSEGQTPLFRAAYMGHQSICELLLEKGASMKGVIHDAIWKHNENIIRILLALGADIEEKDSGGRTPLAHAVCTCHEDICKLLLERGASEKLITSITLPTDLTGHIYKALDNGSITVIRILIAMGADIEGRYGLSSKTPLLWAVSKGRSAIARLLIEKGADLFAHDNAHWTVVHCVVQGRDPEMLTEILKRGAYKLINKGDLKGLTPLHHSVWAQRYHSIPSLTLTKILLEHGASPNIKDKYGRTPYDMAMHQGCLEAAIYLWSQLFP